MMLPCQGMALGCVCVCVCVCVWGGGVTLSKLADSSETHTDDQLILKRARIWKTKI
jgi:hypothetical protein